MKIDTFKDNFVDNIYTNRKLAKYTWFGVGGNAEILFIPEEEKSLENFLKVNQLIVKFSLWVQDLIC